MRVRNFKRFTSLDLPLAPLTILTGINGGGKTSVFHALLLARLASEQGGNEVPLNGPMGLSLGAARDVVHESCEISAEIELVLVGDAGEQRFVLRADDERALQLRIASSEGRVLPDSSRSFVYLCAERLGPRDTLPVDSADHKSLSVGHQGEFTAQVMVTLDRHLVAAERRHPEQPLATLFAQVEAWMRLIVRPVRIESRAIEGVSVAYLRFREMALNAMEVRPTNMGFGVSYALPIIVAGLVIDRGGILLVENPEAHLHPRGQSQIGAFLARVAAAGVQVLLETHSDHVLNGVRRAVAIEKTLAHHDVIAHFFGLDGTREQPESISFDSFGELSAWPRGFFDQLEDDLSSLAQARRKGR
jgi:predicted ATPase